MTAKRRGPYVDLPWVHFGGSEDIVHGQGVIVPVRVAVVYLDQPSPTELPV